MNLPSTLNFVAEAASEHSPPLVLLAIGFVVLAGPMIVPRVALDALARRLPSIIFFIAKKLAKSLALRMLRRIVLGV